MKERSNVSDSLKENAVLNNLCFQGGRQQQICETGRSSRTDKSMGPSIHSLLYLGTGD